jgi:flap endonuclease-1
MGTKLGAIVQAETLSLSDLSGREIAVDAFNSIYSFLAIIRQVDGTPLKDRKGRVTSHLSGLFYRNINLLEKGIHPVYVFDGEPPQLKSEEIERRRIVRKEARKEWKKAKEEGRMEDARKAAQASSKFTKDMVIDSKELLSALGIPHIQAPSEGEALAAQLVQKNLVWASASQDNDSLLYGCPRMIRNLTISGRRKSPSSSGYITIEPELIDLDLNLRLLEISHEQLIDIAILIGTDYNDSPKGIGPKTALKLVKKHASLEEIESATEYDFGFPYEQIRSIFLSSSQVTVEAPEWEDPDFDGIRTILCNEHDFSRSRVDSSLERLEASLEKIRDTTRQSALEDFF